MTWTRSITPDDAAQEGDGLVAAMLRDQHPLPPADFSPATPMPLWLVMARSMAEREGSNACRPEHFGSQVPCQWAVVIEAVRDYIVPNEPDFKLPEFPEYHETARWAHIRQRQATRALLTEEARIARGNARG